MRQVLPTNSRLDYSPKCEPSWSRLFGSTLSSKLPDTNCRHGDADPGHAEQAANARLLSQGHLEFPDQTHGEKHDCGMVSRPISFVSALGRGQVEWGYTHEISHHIDCVCIPQTDGGGSDISRSAACARGTPRFHTGTGQH